MRPLTAVPLVLMLLAGCSDDPEPTATGPTPTATTAAPSPTQEPTPTPTPSPTASPTPQAPTPAKDGDVDGDGTVDAVTATADTLTVTLSGSGRKVTAPVHADSPAPAEVLGSTDVDRDGRAEVFVRTAQGASTSFATPYRFDGRALHELQLDGQPAQLGYGGSTQHGDGFRCVGGRIEVRQAEATGADGSTYAVQLTVYRLTATSLAVLRRASSTARQGSADLQASYAVDCGSVGEGG